MINNSISKIIAITLMITGVGLAYWGYDMSSGLDSQVNQAFTGSSSDSVIYRYIFGAASFFAGLFLFLKK